MRSIFVGLVSLIVLLAPALITLGQARAANPGMVIAIQTTGTTLVDDIIKDAKIQKIELLKPPLGTMLFVEDEESLDRLRAAGFSLFDGKALEFLCISKNLEDEL